MTTAAWGMMSREQRDAAYNNAQAVADSAQRIARWTEASAAWRAAHPRHLDIAYAAKERTKWDLFPGPSADAPCLVHIHGGYWQRNRREVFACLAEGVAQHGWSAALPGYTLAPEASVTDIVGELRNALDWLQSHRAAFAITGPIILSGWSAGGHLAALLLDHPCVAAGLAISGIHELGPLRDTYLNSALRLTDAEIVGLSPLRLPQSIKPLDIAYGSRELAALVEDSRALHAKRAAAHLPGNLVPAPGHDHFTILETLRHPRGLLTRCALGLFAECRFASDSLATAAPR
jgi:arylformamidase